MTAEYCGVCQMWVYPTNVSWNEERPGTTSIVYVKTEEFSCPHVPKRVTRIPYGIPVLE